jgi:hypothetical protein
MKRREDIKPLFPLKHDFTLSLGRFIQEAAMLANAVDSALTHGAIENSAVASILRERLDALRKATYGDG